jgi:heme-degrading monooxygenase HmoA
MPILMIAEQPNLDQQTYTSMINQLMPLLRSAKGFLSHAGGPSAGGGIRIVETWESETDFRDFFEDHLKSNLPPGLTPNLMSYELHAAFVRSQP